MPRYSTLAKLTEMAEEQWGFITRRQALRLGVAQRTLGRLTAPDGVLQRIAHGVYRLRGAPPPDHESLRAAWLQLAPAIPVWERVGSQGVVSHRSAADMYGVGHLAEDRHAFTIAVRHQTRRADVRLHRRKLNDDEWIILRGLPVTRPSRIASDLLYGHEDPSAVAQIISDSLRNVFDYPSTVAEALAPHAGKFGLRRGDGIALLRAMLDLTGDPQTDFWMSEARMHVGRNIARERAPAAVGGNPRRSVSLPHTFEVPDHALWEVGYAREAADSVLADAQTLNEALAIVHPFVNPLLQGTAGGRWDHKRQSWIELKRRAD
jgi:hypothetical protein